MAALKLGSSQAQPACSPLHVGEKLRPRLCRQGCYGGPLRDGWRRHVHVLVERIDTRVKMIRNNLRNVQEAQL